MERTIKQAELSNEVNFSDQVTSRNNEETSFVQASEVEGLPNNSNEIDSESTRHLCTSSEIESGFNQNFNTVNSQQTDEFRKLLESLNGLSEQISQKDYLEYVNDWTESHENEISIVNESAPSINQNLNQTNGHLEMRNKQKGETAVDNNKLSLADAKYGPSKQTDLMLNDLQSMTNDITRMEQNLLYLLNNSHIQQSKNDQITRNSTYDDKLPYKCNTLSSEGEFVLNETLFMRENSTSMIEFPQNEIPNLFNDIPANEEASVSDSRLTSKAETSEPESSKELHPNASVKRHSVDLNKVMQKSSTRKLHSNADTLIDKKGKKYICEVCHKSFKRKEHLNNHVPMHSDERPFTCEVCNKKFKSKKLLKMHTNIHTEKKFSCKFCNKSFKQRSYLKQHELIHSGETPYVCKTCGESFTRSSRLKRHNFKHTGEKPFDCPFCNKKFSRKDCLNQHLITHKHK